MSLYLWVTFAFVAGAVASWFDARRRINKRLEVAYRKGQLKQAEETLEDYQELLKLSPQNGWLLRCCETTTGEIAKARDELRKFGRFGEWEPKPRNE